MADVASLRTFAAPLIGGALLAWSELAGGFWLLPPDASGRAEALPFLIWRPWLLVAAVLLAAAWRLPRRIALYAAFLVAAAAGETMLVFRLGAADPWPEMLRGLAAGVLVAVLADLVSQALARWGRWRGRLAALVLLGGAVFLLSGSRPYEALLIGPTAPRAAAGPKPPMLLMTSLPIVWGAGGAFDPASRPAETYRLLEREYAVSPIDAIEPATLRGRRLMLLAQPRLLAPEELVTLDAWVRGGGRVLVLTDPALVAAREFAPADMTRPPEAGLLGPLLDHWGLRLEHGNPHADLAFLPGEARGARKLKLDRPGRFSLTGNSCHSAGRAWLVRCRIGRGEVLVAADADILTDRTWTAPGADRGAERHLRTADNPLVVADWLDSLAGIERQRLDRPVAWIAPGAPRLRAMVTASVPGAAALVGGILLLLGGTRRARR